MMSGGMDFRMSVVSRYAGRGPGLVVVRASFPPCEEAGCRREGSGTCLKCIWICVCISLEDDMYAGWTVRLCCAPFYIAVLW